MDINNPDVHRFLSDPLFVRLVEKGIEDPEWKSYESANWEQRELMASARMILLASDRFPNQTLDAARKDFIWSRVKNEIEDHTKKRGSEFRARNPFVWWAAAILVLMAGSVTWWSVILSSGHNGQLASEKTDGRWRELFNSNSTVLPVDLPDGSSVLLEPESRLTYLATGFADQDRREIFLKGEAFFEIAPNAEKPFYVYVNGLTTKVVGTSFNVRAFPDDQHVEVIVKTGRITVFASQDDGKNRSEPAGETVNPDERIVLDRSSRQLSVDKLTPAETRHEKELFDYDDKHVTDVFEALERSYKIEIRYPEEKLKECKITAELTHETLYEKIRLICLGLNATYEVVDGAIVIKSDGCM